MTLVDILSEYRILSLVVIATAVGVIFGVLEYNLGKAQKENIFEHTDRLSPETLERIQNTKNQIGSSILILSGFPLVGPPMSIAAGVMDIRLRTFVVWGTVGRLLSNTLLVMIFGQTALWIGRLVSG